jgi:formate hydrogenlyase subunit 3/multisubunit Na+/H+ antiporter MnhD subunit
MVMWELMALSSFFLVTANHVIPEIRRAGYLYLLVAHIGALAILLCFGVLQANTGEYTFANMRAQQLTPFWASVAFLLALFGFGARRASCRCMSGCPRRIPPRRRRCRH